MKCLRIEPVSFVQVIVESIARVKHLTKLEGLRQWHIYDCLECLRWCQVAWCGEIDQKSETGPSCRLTRGVPYIMTSEVPKVDGIMVHYRLRISIQLCSHQLHVKRGKLHRPRPIPGQAPWLFPKAGSCGFFNHLFQWHLKFRWCWMIPWVSSLTEEALGRRASVRGGSMEAHSILLFLSLGMAYMVLWIWHSKACYRSQTWEASH